MNIDEFQVPVPWGHLAVKAWGDKKNPIVLVFHGVLDNSGSFDRLIPHLPPSFYYVCFDLPGHGQSSHFPPHLPIFTINYVIVYKIIVDYFKQDKYIFMGHSYGAQISVLFGQLYPEHIERLIMLDALRMFPVPVNLFQSSLREKLEFPTELSKRHEGKSAPSYTFNEALDRAINTRYHGSLTEEAAEPIVRRNLKPDGEGKFNFTIDQRLKNFINPIHDIQFSLATLKKFPLVCPCLIILGKDSELQQIVLKPFLSHYKRRKNYVVKYVEGNHDVHNNNPEVVGPLITGFLLNQKAKL